MSSEGGTNDARRVQRHMLIRAISSIVSPLVLVACAGSGATFGRDIDPQALYADAMKAYRNDDCGFASAAFQRFSFELSRSEPRQADAQYYMAECEFRSGDPLTAVQLFRNIADQFPDHRLAADALLRAGDAYAALWKRPQLDAQYGDAAWATYRELMSRYDGTPQAARAQLRIQRLNERFAEKDYRAGLYYLRLHAFDSAIIYFKGVVAEFGQSSYAPKSVVKLIEAYARLDYVEEQTEMCQYLRQFYPAHAGEATQCAAEDPAP
jgi:outer membrane assembly lipoprotein YfiO